MRIAAFLDRDGVLNEDLGFVGSVDRFRWISGAIEAVHFLQSRGLMVFVVTNQSGIARGFFDENAVTVLHTHMQQELHAAGTRIDAFRYCPHHPHAVRAAYRRDCSCRKPAPGLLLELIDQYDIDVSGSLMIGDRESDIIAARNAGIAGFKFAGGSLVHFVQNLFRVS